MPRPDAAQACIISAFWKLSGSRTASFGSAPHPISIQAIAHWHEWGGFEAIGFDRFEFLEWMQFLDGVFREAVEKTNKAKEKAQ